MTSEKDKKRILIVEDEVAIIEVLTEALESEGYEVESTSDARQALSLINGYDPHVVITDNDMPNITGIELLKTLRQQENYVTVIFVSGRTDAQFVVDALRAGADDFIRKPFRMNELVARIETTLRHNESHRDLLEANRKLKSMVDHDYLTGLFNMRSMYDKIDLELKRAKRYGRSLTCVMLDMDHFKSVNDENDHLFGSFVLKEMGQIITETMREVDFAARYGGDEFLVVLVEADKQGAEIFCERLRQRVEKNVFDNGNNQMQLTISQGYASFNGADEVDARSLVRNADFALYRAKEKGRNCFSD